MELDVTAEQLARWRDGDELVQDVFPHLTASEREFLISGATAEEWAEAFSVCPGCDAVGDEPCADDCPDKRIAERREDEARNPREP